ncbi:hypothetical protein [Saccharothrix stipae]
MPLLVIAATLAGPGQAISQARIAAADSQLPPTPGPVSPEQGNPQVFSLTRDANHAFRYSFAAVAADLGRSYAAGTVEADLKEGLLSLPAADRAPIVATAKQLVTASANTRVAQFGRHGSLTADQFRALGFAGAFRSVQVDWSALAAAAAARAQELAREDKAQETDAQRKARERSIDLATTPRLTSLDFRIDRVRAIEETDEWSDSDEILMGGMQIDPAGVTRKVSPWLVSGDFDAGEAVDYTAPGRLFSRSSLTTTGTWPRTYVAVVMMAEEDHGGFASALHSAWAKVAEQVRRVVVQGTAAVVSPSLGEVIGELIGQVVGWIVDEAVRWFIGMFEDDLFDARTAVVRLPHRYEFLYRQAADLGWTDHRLPTTEMRFVGHGGDYRVNVHWQVNA